MSLLHHPSSNDIPGRMSKSDRIALAAVIGSGLLTLAGFGLYAYNHSERPGAIDDPVVMDTAADACRTMTRAVESSADRATVDVVRAQSAAVQNMITMIRALGPDRLEGDEPVQTWLSDWETLADARDRYAAGLAAGGSAEFVMPTRNGRTIDSRIDDVSSRSGMFCRVPSQLKSG